jgi:hypothetical protein
MRICLQCFKEATPRSKFCREHQKFRRREYLNQKRIEYYDRKHPENSMRRQKKRICIHYKQLQLGSPNPWRINDYSCGNNRGGVFPERLPKWSRCWRDEKGRLQDEHTITLMNAHYDFENGILFCFKETGEPDALIRWEWQLSQERINEIHRRLGINGKKSAKELRNEEYLIWEYWKFN